VAVDWGQVAIAALVGGAVGGGVTALKAVQMKRQQRAAAARGEQGMIDPVDGEPAARVDEGDRPVE